jgi:prepilin-type processing-associated H-X9-DG protein
MKLIGGGYRSFSITGPMNGEGDAPYYAEKITDIVLPASKFVFIENTDDRGYNMGSWIMYVDPPGWIDPLAVWHRVRSTFGFADGHAEAQRWVDKSTFDMIVLDRNPPCTFNQTVYSTDSRQDVEWAAKHYVAKYLP